MRGLLTSIFLTLLLISGVASSGAIYRWVDNQGQVHYGDQPTGVTAKLLKGSAAKEGDKETIQRLQGQQDLLQSYQEKRVEDRVKRKDTIQERTERISKCTEAKERLARLQQARYVYKPSESGAPQKYNGAERAAAEQRATKNVKTLCG